MVTKFRPREYDVCVAACDYLKLKYPDVWSVTHHIQNEGANNGSFRKRQGRVGVKSGFPDYAIFYPNNSWHGLLIEVKRDAKSKPTQTQKDWIVRLCNMGYYACVAFGIDHFISIVEGYLSEGERSSSSVEKTTSRTTGAFCITGEDQTPEIEDVYRGVVDLIHGGKYKD